MFTSLIPLIRKLFLFQLYLIIWWIIGKWIHWDPSRAYFPSHPACGCISGADRRCCLQLLSVGNLRNNWPCETDRSSSQLVFHFWTLPKLLFPILSASLGKMYLFMPWLEIYADRKIRSKRTRLLTVHFDPLPIGDSVLLNWERTNSFYQAYQRCDTQNAISAVRLLWL